MQIRNLAETDYPRVIAVVDAWWGKTVAPMLPRLFFDHFSPTSFIAEEGDALAGFICGFLSPARPAEAYIHFVGVAPELRRAGVARTLYERFFALAGEHGRSVLHAVTSPWNTRSMAFHRAMGFTIVPGDGELDGISFHRAYDGDGGDRVLFEKRL